jgi:hypothetical protein
MITEQRARVTFRFWKGQARRIISNSDVLKRIISAQGVAIDNLEQSTTDK